MRRRRYSAPGNGSSTVEMSPEAKKQQQKRRQRQQASLDRRCAELAGPVTVTYLPRDVGGEQPGRTS